MPVRVLQVFRYWIGDEMTITNELEERLNGMCPVARASAIGTAIKAVEAGLTEFDRWKDNRVIYGFGILDPTTPSSQGSGAVAPEIRVNAVPGAVVVNGDTYMTYTASEFDDFPVGSPPVLEVGEFANAAIIGVFDSYASVTAVWGPQTDDGLALPSDSDIRTWLLANGYRADYVRMAIVRIDRAADTVLNQSIDNTWRDW